MGDRSDQASRQHQPPAGRRTRCRVGCVHRFSRATCRPNRDQSPDGARIPQAGRCRKSTRVLPGPNRALGRCSTRFRTSDVGMGRARSQACLPGHGRRIGNGKKTARNQPRLDAEWRWVCRMPSVTERLVVSSPSVCEVWAHRLLRIGNRCCTSWRRSISYEWERDSGHRICYEQRIERSHKMNGVQKEPSMNAVQIEQKSYEMPPREGISIAQFLTVADIERSARYYERVFGARILSLGDGNAPGYLQLANIWMILNVGGGPTPDKPTVTLSVPDPNHINSFMNFRVADIQACYELWKSRGAEFITEPIPKYGETRCYIRDPDGYIIEVGQSTDLKYG